MGLLCVGAELLARPRLDAVVSLGLIFGGVNAIWLILKEGERDGGGRRGM